MLFPPNQGILLNKHNITIKSGDNTDALLLFNPQLSRFASHPNNIIYDQGFNQEFQLQFIGHVS